MFENAVPKFERTQ